MTWSFEEMVAIASLEETLEVGDCLAAGSPPNGTGSEVGRWVKPGDVVECEISDIGVLRNSIGKRSEAGTT
jgi:2-keto-4-pentenoate hydratase/2-oxohepta-3-ene-1,7-dioic acid hydratase in catechol pathway